jgi:hypothetical protein
MSTPSDTERCPYCRRLVRVMPVVNGTPTPQEMEAMERGELRVRDSVHGFHSTAWACSDCGAEW